MKIVARRRIRKALRRIGQGDQSAARSRIIEAAAYYGCEDLIPEHWQNPGSQGNQTAGELLDQIARGEEHRAASGKGRLVPMAMIEGLREQVIRGEPVMSTGAEIRLLANRYYELTGETAFVGTENPGRGTKLYLFADHKPFTNGEEALGHMREPLKAAEERALRQEQAAALAERARNDARDGVLDPENHRYPKS